MAACNPSQKAKNNLVQLNKFVSGVEIECNSYTDKNWTEADSTFNGYKAFFTDEQLDLLSAEQRDEFGKLEGKYIGMKSVYSAKKVFNDVQEGVKDFGNKAKGFIEGVRKSLESDTIKNK